MKDKKFIISGIVDNVDIPDIEDEEEEDDKSPRIKMNLKDFLKNIGNGAPRKMISPEEFNRLINETGMNEEEIEKMIQSINDIFKNNVTPEFIKEMEEKFGNKKDEELSNDDVNNIFNSLFKDIETSKSEESEELEGLGEEEAVVPEKRTEGSSFKVVSDPDSLGAVIHNKNEYLYETFVKAFGEGPVYEMKIFAPNVGVSNIVEGMEYLTKLEYVGHNDRYILLKGIPSVENLESIIIAVIQNGKDIELVVPKYGNTYNFDDKRLYDKELDTDVYVETPKGKVLMNPVNIEKIKVGLDLALLENKRPISSIADFGKVLISIEEVEGSGQFIKMGRIQSNESFSAIVFKKDFDLDLDKKIFDFYVKLPKKHSKKTLEAVRDYLLTINFNENNKTLNSELEATSNKSIYLNLDLGDFPDNIIEWMKD
jgi:hypothetical protein